LASRIGPIERFPRPASLANYWGLTPGCRNSGDATDRLGSITKQGSAMARFVLGQAILHVLRRDARMRAWYGRIKRRRGSKIARVAAMRRLATIIWHMVKHNQPYLAPPEVRQRRERTRYRMALSALRTGVKNRVQAILHRLGILHDFSDLFGRAGRRFLEGLGLPEGSRQTLKGYLDVLDVLTRLMGEVEQWMKENLEEDEIVRTGAEKGRLTAVWRAFCADGRKSRQRKGTAPRSRNRPFRIRSGELRGWTNYISCCSAGAASGFSAFSGAWRCPRFCRNSSIDLKS
jgi:transposase